MTNAREKALNPDSAGVERAEGTEGAPAPRKARKSKGTSPTARALAECRKRNWLAEKVEQTVAHSFIKRDLFSFGDVLALDGQPGSLIIQATSGAMSGSGGHGANRVRKIATECADKARRWLLAGNRISVWTFAKQGAAGKQKRWKLKEEPVTLDMLSKECP